MPSEDRGDELQQHHNDGQTDASHGEHNPPHTDMHVHNWGQDKSTYNKMVEDNEAYEKGQDNVK